MPKRVNQQSRGGVCGVAIEVGVAERFLWWHGPLGRASTGRRSAEKGYQWARLPAWS